ncbi:3' terminal RNA ribose 2'-O-methyltransferase Hen1 [Streptomyces sp. JJ36]|uniref:3' terminal RNA ribose 2'-O-methyltransferase Hen1 n=1 Tax=Streptomyces sp. JJ36 TaxID=2736645 RepID=UPI001F0278A6|nr:3' terminal RNA ribose 2'-O-methyltransferase Hen1 [Streptomyces sp. JJ36]MCF6522684.1 3' terminal RNA ribose 2'-O-methyltransferase Hen1 [Streptomyces sp. JJ36]
MFLSLSAAGTPGAPATDLGYLLHKHPDRAQPFSTSAGTAHVFYPRADAARCTAALLLEVDPVALVRRGRGRAPDSALAQYVNDRPYAASSLLAVALGAVFRSALAGKCRQRPELPERILPLRAEVPALPARGGPALVRRLFEPLGWAVDAEPVPLDARFPEWGDSRYVRLVLEGEQRVSAALRQLYVLLPVLDGAKHYWVTADEADKLLRAGEGWLEHHPEQDLIAGRYLARRATLTRQVLERLELARLATSDDAPVEELDNAVPDEQPGSAEEHTGTAGARVVQAPGASAGGGPGRPPSPAEAGEPTVPAAREADVAHPGLPAGAEAPAGPARAHEGPSAGHGHDGAGAPGVPPVRDRTADRAHRPGHAAPPTGPSLAEQRRTAVLAALREAGAEQVLDLGCGEGRLLAELLGDGRFTRITGLDVSVRALQAARRRLRTDRMSERQAARITLLHGSLVYTDTRLTGHDAAVLSEVVEHVDAPRLPALEHAVFAAARPGTVVVTTPNAEYNVRWETLPAGRLRHADHRFEWTRTEFRAWAGRVARRHGYAVELRPVGPDDPEVGPPTQLAVFTASPKAREAAASPTPAPREAPV